MSKGRKVPPPPPYRKPYFRSFREEFDFYLHAGDQSKELAYRAIDGMPLNQDALIKWQEIYTDEYERLCEVQGFEREPMDYVYLFEANGLYKIGVTRDIPKRIRSLQTGNPHPIRLIDFCILVSGSVGEHEIFKHLNPKRLEGEWFALTDEDVKIVCGWFKDGIPTVLENVTRSARKSG